MRPTLDRGQEVILEWAQVTAQQAVPGLHRVDSYTWLSDVADHLMVGLTGYVMKDQAGPVTRVTKPVTRKVRPRWIPKWLWRRVPEESRTFTLTTTPEWTYPQATIRIPDLKPAVRFMTNHLDHSDWIP